MHIKIFRSKHPYLIKKGSEKMVILWLFHVYLYKIVE